MSIPILLLCGILGWVLRKFFIVPSNLAHIPRVSVLSLLWSYIIREPENERIQRLLVPLANESGHPIVLVWTFGLWIIHILDFKVGEAALRDRRWVRQLPPKDLLLWRFVGTSNVAFTIGETWRKHSKVVNTALQGPPPIESFVRTSQELFTVLGKGGTFKWNELAHGIALDILGDAVLGYRFKAVLQPNSPFVTGYRDMMESLTAPPYIFLPFLDKYFPRKHVIAQVDDFRSRFAQIIQEKEQKKSHDLISRMLENPDFKFSDVLDNVSVLFVAGHETTAGTLSSIVYYLAKYTKCQDQVREEARNALQGSDVVDHEMLTKMPFAMACIQETMRANSASNFTLFRQADTPMMLGHYSIPANTLMCLNVSATHHLETTWADHRTFDPYRFLSNEKTSAPTSFPIATFGLGLRQCPARQFATWELRAVLAMLVVNYTWRLEESSIHKDYIKSAPTVGTNMNLPTDLDIVFQKL